VVVFPSHRIDDEHLSRDRIEVGFTPAGETLKSRLTPRSLERSATAPSGYRGPTGPDRSARDGHLSAADIRPTRPADAPAVARVSH
jgi:hypothetical protein